MGSDLDERLAPAPRRGARTRLLVGAAVVLVVAGIAAAVIAGMTGAAGTASVVEASALPDELTGADGAAPTPTAEGLLVHVVGAVAKPGLYRLGAGARVADAVAAAGGFTAEADPAGVNLARKLGDGEQLVVLAVGQAPPPGASAGQAGGSVSLNSASVEQLDELPRIGPALAQRIVDWRQAHGGFASIEQLQEVAGIGDAVYAGLVDRVTL